MEKKLVISIIIIVLFAGSFWTYNNYIEKSREEIAMANKSVNGDIEIVPVEHATMVLKWGDVVIYTDPTGGAKAFAGKPEPDIILITDSHGDHFNVETLEAVSKESTSIIAPLAMSDMLPGTIAGTFYVMKNGQKTTEQGLSVEAIPMYNLPEKEDNYHTKGRGNGYVLEAGDGRRVYISGDTADIPEMRALKNIDIAFVSMNLPYTMSVESAASGVLAFGPKQVYPYHYRGPGGLSDVGKFKELVNAGNSAIEVVQLNWYPN